MIVGTYDVIDTFFTGYFLGVVSVFVAIAFLSSRRN